MKGLVPSAVTVTGMASGFFAILVSRRGAIGTALVIPKARASTFSSSSPDGHLDGMSMTPDGKRFVCSVQEPQSDVWIVDNLDPAVK